MHGSKSIYVTRRGSPLVLGKGEGFNAVSSDVLGLPDNTKEIIFLEENDIAELNESSILIYNINNKNIERENINLFQKKNLKLKEIINILWKKKFFINL